MLRDRLLEALPNEDEVVEGGFDVDAARLELGELGSWLAEHAPVIAQASTSSVTGAQGPAMPQPSHWPLVTGRGVRRGLELGPS